MGFLWFTTGLLSIRRAVINYLCSRKAPFSLGQIELGIGKFLLSVVRVLTEHYPIGIYAMR